MKKKHIKKIAKKATKVVFWFTVGVVFGLFFCVSFVFIIFQKLNANVVYPGITVDGINLGGKKEEEVIYFFSERNAEIANTKFTFTSGEGDATVSASQINYGYDENLIAKQAFELGRSDDIFSNISIIATAYLNGLMLNPAYHYSEQELLKTLSPIAQKIYVAPVDALFVFKNNRVTTFRPSTDGMEIDFESLDNILASDYFKILTLQKPQNIIIPLPVKTLKPNVTTDKINNLGIKELIGQGTSLFQDSIPNRIYNITLATSRLNGVLVAPNEIFSFNNALGDVSAFSGYEQAYVIQNGRTVLGDGGGVCQVSTTLFRALLNAGLPIVERHAHAYRVGYYEEDSPPGLDATVYAPSVDLKFKNDTGNYILIQTSINPDILQLTFSLYGTKDGRISIVNKPVILSQSPALPTVYQDDPTLPKGEIKQVDFSAMGADVYFTREVIKNGKVIISDKFVSDFQPWAAVYLVGTK